MFIGYATGYIDTDCSGRNDNSNNVNDNRQLDNRRSRTVNLKQLESQKRMLEKKVAKQERAKAKVKDLQLQLENLRQTRIADDRSNRTDVQTLSKCDRVQSDVQKLRRENDELMCCVRSKTSEEMRIADEIERLINDRTKIAEYARELSDRVHDEKARAKALKKRHTDLEQAIEHKATEVQKARRELTDAEADAKCQYERLLELQRYVDERCRTHRDVAAEVRRREAELAALRETRPTQLARAVRSLDAMAEKLADARAAATGWEAERERAAEERRKVKATGDEAKCRAKAELRALDEERRVLDDLLDELSWRLAEAESDNRRLVDAARAEADRLAGLACEVDRLEKRTSHERLMLTVKRTMAETEKALLVRRDTVEGLKMTMAVNELDALRKLCDR